MDGKLKPGMFATATILIPSSEDEEVIVIPSSAIQQIEGETAVFVQEGEYSFVMRGVSLGKETGVYIHVLQGLDPGDRVVTQGAFDLKSILLKEELGGGHSH
jgi:cobalt-zinc-cadmium efflux system membrane fusion protein